MRQSPSEPDPPGGDILRGAAIALWTVDASGARLHVSDGWPQLSGQSVDDWLAEGVAPLVHPDDRARVERTWEDALRDGLAFEHAFRIIDRRTGEERVLEERAVAEATSRGLVFVGSTDDITARVARERVAAEVARTQAAVERVAALVAAGAALRELAEAVARETGELLGGVTAAVGRFV